MDQEQLTTRDFLSNGNNIGVRVYGDQRCVVMERYTLHSPWREVGQSFALPLPENFDVPVMVPGPKGKLNLAVILCEIDHPEHALRLLLIAPQRQLNDGEKQPAMPASPPL